MKGVCKHCGRCERCGRGADVAPNYVPMPYVNPLPNRWIFPPWINTPGNTGTNYFDPPCDTMRIYC